MVYYRMTIRTDGAKVSDGINFVVLANFGKLKQMMDVYKSLSDLTIAGTE